MGKVLCNVPISCNDFLRFVTGVDQGNCYNQVLLRVWLNSNGYNLKDYSLFDMDQALKENNYVVIVTENGSNNDNLFKARIWQINDRGIENLRRHCLAYAERYGYNYNGIIKF